MHKTQVLLKEDNKWYWLGCHNVQSPKYKGSMIEYFSLTEDKSKADVFTADDINVFKNTDSRWLEPIEAIRRYHEFSHSYVEFRRNPHKLALGIHELMVTEKSDEI